MFGVSTQDFPQLAEEGGTYGLSVVTVGLVYTSLGGVGRAVTGALPSQLIGVALQYLILDSQQYCLTTLDSQLSSDELRRLTQLLPLIRILELSPLQLGSLGRGVGAGAVGSQTHLPLIQYLWGPQ